MGVSAWLWGAEARLAVGGFGVWVEPEELGVMGVGGAGAVIGAPWAGSWTFMEAAVAASGAGRAKRATWLPFSSPTTPA